MQYLPAQTKGMGVEGVRGRKRVCVAGRLHGRGMHDGVRVHGGGVHDRGVWSSGACMVVVRACVTGVVGACIAEWRVCWGTCVAGWDIHGKGRHA